MRFAPAVKSLAVILLFALASAAPAHAQHNKQIISGTWYEDRAFSSSSPATDTFLTFTQTPANKFLNITLVSCSISSLSNQILADVILQVGSETADMGRPQSVRGAASTASNLPGFTNYYSVVSQTYYKVGPGRFPGLQILAPYASSSGSGGYVNFVTANCTIVGNLSDN